MSIQDIFYLLGSIYMTVGIILMVFIGIVLLIIANSIYGLRKLIEEKIDVVSHIAEDPSGLAMRIGSKMARSVVKKMKEMITSENKK